MIESGLSPSDYLSEQHPIHKASPRLSLVWRIVIVWIAMTGVWLLIGSLADTVFGQDYSRSGHIFRAALTSLIVIPVIAWARRFLDRRSWAGLGLTSVLPAWRPFFIGMLCWLIPATVGLLICLAVGWVEITTQEALVDILLMGGRLLVLVFIYEALPEELIFRGYFYRNLADVMPRWVAILGQALLFVLWGLANGGPNSLDRSLLFLMAAIILGVFRVVTDSLWASIGFHLAFQTIVQLLGTIGNQFTISDPQLVSVFVFGILPFATAITILNMFYKNRPNWFEREPEKLSAVNKVSQNDRV